MKTKNKNLVGTMVLSIALLGLMPHAFASATEATEAPVTVEEKVATRGDQVQRIDMSECGTPASCDDRDPCTVDSCINGVCKHTDVTCDDNNTCTNDSCNKTNGACEFVQNGTCDVTPPAPRCGDSHLDVGAGEQCDDGNLIDGDGCSSTCKNEAPPQTPPAVAPPAATPPPAQTPTPDAPPVQAQQPVVDTPQKILAARIAYRWNFDDQVTTLDGKTFILDDAKPSSSVVTVSNLAYKFAIAVQNKEMKPTDENQAKLVAAGVDAINDALVNGAPVLVELAEPSVSTEDNLPHLKLVNTDVNEIKSMIKMDPNQLASQGTLPLSAALTGNAASNSANVTNQIVIYRLQEESMGGCSHGHANPSAALGSLIPNRPSTAGAYGAFLFALVALGLIRLRRFSL